VLRSNRRPLFEGGLCCGWAFLWPLCRPEQKGAGFLNQHQWEAGKLQFERCALANQLDRKEAMLPSQFLKTIYLGDRACKSLLIDGWNKRIAIQVDEISRIRSLSGKWDYYNEENITDGLLVFSDIRSVLFDPAGPIPNDYIADLSVEALVDDYHRFRFVVASADEFSQSTEVVVTIDAKHLHLEDPLRPGVAIE